MDVITKTFPTYTPGGWDLSELLPEPSEAVFAARLAALEAAVAAFEPAARGPRSADGARAPSSPSSASTRSSTPDPGDQRLRLALVLLRHRQPGGAHLPQPRAPGDHARRATASSSSPSGGAASPTTRPGACCPARPSTATTASYLQDLRRFKPLHARREVRADHQHQGPERRRAPWSPSTRCSPTAWSSTSRWTARRASSPATS